MKHILFLLFAFFSFSLSSIAQTDSVKYLSIAGRIVDKESNEAMSGVKITNESRNNIVASKVSGFYSIVGAPGDIIRFTHIGYEPVYMKINETESSKATVMIHMQQDDYFMEEVIVGELPSEDELNDYFLSLDVGDDKGRELAEQNPETFKILDNIEEPPPGGPVSFLKKNLFDPIKKKKKKPGRAKKLPKYKE